MTPIEQKMAKKNSYRIFAYNISLSINMSEDHIWAFVSRQHRPKVSK